MTLETPESAFELNSTIQFVRKYYESQDDILLGVVPYTEENRREAHRVISEYLEKQTEGWKSGDIVDGREVEHVSYRVDAVSDIDYPDYCQQIKDEDRLAKIKAEDPERMVRTPAGTEYTWETIAEVEERTGEKVQGSGKNFLTVAVCRRFKNPLNGIYMVDDEVNGWVPTDAVKPEDDIRDQSE